MDEDGIKITTFFLDSDSDECEVGLLKSLDNTLGMIRPLCVIGYGIRQYDIPLLCIKKQHYSLLLWKLIDMCESAVHIDLYHILKYKGYKKLEDALSSSEFSGLPLRIISELVPKDRKKKGPEIYRLWREDREKLKKYTQNEVYNMLLLSEKIMSEGFQTR